ncbi:hypothetical protein [Microbulbifer yueqingensis]|uniref:Uncharacterized protein n=1 Tax=Microbulbifer yueqingensis TaxID=658219 RepID=A0A1G9BYA7_9GAMM|nr:hypothetical protein [Microbulbifer yueqingensis]SDK43935.1 hypothetical protein SAMN05216212_2396 [Microbulbifer yueqingensis]
MYNQYRQMQRNIDLAVMREREQGDFRQAVLGRLTGLHRSIQLPEGDSALHLTCFAIRYVRVVPRWLHQLQQLLEAAGIDFQPLQEMIDKGLAAMSGAAGTRPDLGALAQEAYFSHRAMEEVNDRLHPLCGSPLLPMDPLLSNLIMRELLDEQRCEETDNHCWHLGRVFADLEFSSDRVVALFLCQQKFNESPGDWPDLAEGLQFRLLTPDFSLSSDSVH